MVHTFTALGQYLAADVNSGAVHVLDKLSYDLLSLVEGPMGEQMPEELPEIEMNLNRPFAFMITGVDGLPLFIGVVNTMV